MIIKNLQEFYQVLPINRPLIALDYGVKKIGVAVSEVTRTIAMPACIITETNHKKRIKIILDLIQKYNACAIVIGLPLNMNGEIGEQAQLVLKFAEDFAKNTELPTYMQDERLTTKAANNFLKSFGIKRRERNDNDDIIAASMILETTINAFKNLY